MVGDPTSLQDALSVSDGAYFFSVFAALASGGVILGLRPVARRESAIPAELADGFGARAGS